MELKKINVVWTRPNQLARPVGQGTGQGTGPERSFEPVDLGTGMDWLNRIFYFILFWIFNDFLIRPVEPIGLAWPAARPIQPSVQCEKYLKRQLQQNVSTQKMHQLKPNQGLLQKFSLNSFKDPSNLNTRKNISMGSFILSYGIIPIACLLFTKCIRKKTYPYETHICIWQTWIQVTWPQTIT